MSDSGGEGEPERKKSRSWSFAWKGKKQRKRPSVSKTPSSSSSSSSSSSTAPVPSSSSSSAATPLPLEKKGRKRVQATPGKEQAAMEKIMDEVLELVSSDVQPKNYALGVTYYARVHGTYGMLDRALALTKSKKTKRRLAPLQQIRDCTEEGIETLWQQACDANEHFGHASIIALRQFEDHAFFAGTSELSWTSHFFAALGLGGHRIRDLAERNVAVDADVAFQGVQALPVTGDRNFVKPDLCLGVRPTAIGATAFRWPALCAGTAVLPLDLCEFKSDRVNVDLDWSKLLYEVVMAGNHQIDFLDAVLTTPEGKDSSLFTAAIPMAFGTHVCGTHFSMACLWHTKGQGLQVGLLIDMQMTKPVDYKRCFLLRHEVVKIVCEFAEMVSRITHEVPLRQPRQDAWWKRFCVCQTRHLYGLLVQCTKCANWFHPECLRLAADAVPAPGEVWYCQLKHCNQSNRNQAPKASAEPREPRGPRDGAEGAVTTGAPSTPLPVLLPIKMLFKNSKSEVWLCKNPSSSLPGGSLDKHERVVVKLPFDPPGTFNYEEDILRQLRQVPNVAQLLDVVHFTPDDRPARLGLVLPYYDTGGDLSLGQHASDQLFADYTRQLLQAIRDIHQRGVIHRDISPTNVLFVPKHGDSQPTTTVLIDFNLAIDEQWLGSSWLASGKPVGTRGFIAPEIRNPSGCALADHKVDVWSAGVLIASQLLGRWLGSDDQAEAVVQLPFAEALAWVQSRKLSGGPAPRFLTPSRWQFVHRMLAMDPGDRIDAATAVGDFDAYWWRSNEGEEATYSSPAWFKMRTAVDAL